MKKHFVLIAANRSHLQYRQTYFLCSIKILFGILTGLVVFQLQKMWALFQYCYMKREELIYFTTGVAWVFLYSWILWKAKFLWFLLICDNFITFELWHSIWLIKTKSPLLTSCLNFLRIRTFYSITIKQLATLYKNAETYKFFSRLQSLIYEKRIMELYKLVMNLSWVMFMKN